MPSSFSCLGDGASEAATPALAGVGPPYLEVFAPMPQANAYYGQSISVSGDGSTLAIGSPGVTSALVSQAPVIETL